MPLGAPTEIREEHAEKSNMVHAESCMCIYVRVGRGWVLFVTQKQKLKLLFSRINRKDNQIKVKNSRFSQTTTRSTTPLKDNYHALSTFWAAGCIGPVPGGDLSHCSLLDI